MKSQVGFSGAGQIAHTKTSQGNHPVHLPLVVPLVDVEGASGPSGPPSPPSPFDPTFTLPNQVPSPATTANTNRPTTATIAEATTWVIDREKQQNPSPPPTPTSNLHSHRQNHNSSKLPTFRFTDLKSLSASGLQLSLAHQSHHRNHATPSPVSPNPALSDGAAPLGSESASAPASAPAPADGGDSDPVLPGQRQSQVQTQNESKDPTPDSSPGLHQTPEPAPATTQIRPSTSTSVDHAEKDSPSQSAPVPEPPPSVPLLAPTSSQPPPEPATGPVSVPVPVLSLESGPGPGPVFVPAPAPEPAPAATPSTLVITSQSHSHSAPPSRPRSQTSSTHPQSPAAAPIDIQKENQVSRSDDASDNHQSLYPYPAAVTRESKPRRRRPLSLARGLERAAAATATFPPLSLNSPRQSATDVIHFAPPLVQNSAPASPTGQREFIWPRALSSTSPTDEKRSSLTSRPPVSYRPPAGLIPQPSSATQIRVPPTRTSRSPGSQKSVVLDMNARSRYYDMVDDAKNSSHDRTLRALEGRVDRDLSYRTPTSAAYGVADDDTSDVFLKIAREETGRRPFDDNVPSETQSVVSRVKRSSHRRPLSTTVPSYKPTSPPQIPRRLSEQNNSQPRHFEDDRMTEISRMPSYRTPTREKAASAHPGEDLNRTKSSASALRPSALSSRSMAFQDNGVESSSHSRRRSSVTENNSTAQGRAYKPTTYYGQTKAYNSSPLVRSFDSQSQHPADQHNGAEGTESTGSTTAPSTVWDELDDLKSRIHRLELTGKLPSTSGAAMSRISDERPPTATTTVTTMSSSPKRPGAGVRATDSATTVTQRETHPILHAALSKSKLFIDAEVFRALESAAHEAMSLSAMMGTPGLPGPISSGASSIGVGTTLTDRQLRRKADSVCRSLTELCVALGEEVAKLKAPPAPASRVAQPPQPQQEAPVAQPVQSRQRPQNEPPTTPTVKTFSGLPSQRRQSIPTEKNLPGSDPTSPKTTMSKFEERRISLLSGSGLPSPRAVQPTPSTPLDANPSRRTSLLMSRSRRAGTEEPDEGAGRRSSLLLRSRRTGAEEPEEGRRTSLLVRNRRGTMDEDNDEERFRMPARAHTDLHSARGSGQREERASYAPDSDPSQTSSGLPRRRFLSSNLAPSRLATPSMPSLSASRRYAERSPVEANIPDKYSEEHAQRYTSLGHTMIPNRSGSLSRRPNRDSGYTLNSNAATAGGYR